MKSTFQRMYNLINYSTSERLEDYFTEIIAPIFKDKNILESFLNRFSNGIFDDLHNIRVSTQKTYFKILDHDTDSRPDLVITFESKQRRHLMFFENKLQTGEGVLQLKRYSDHLNNHNLKGYKTYLFYITKEYDPKDNNLYTNNGNKFNQIQWFQIYSWLIAFKEENLYVNEVLNYMEVNALNKRRRFTPVDINAMQNLSTLQEMLDDTLDGKLKNAFENLFGKPMKWSNRAKQLRDCNRYILISDQSDWKFIGCGFWFTDDDYPEISVFLEVESNCIKKEELLRAISTFCDENKDWEFEGPEDERDGFILYFDKSLLDFLSENDQIDSIQEHIIKKLKLLHILKTNYPELKWVARG
jgi:hypothetical protein